MLARIYCFLYLAIVLLGTTLVFGKELTYYADFERTKCTYYNPNYFLSVNLTAKRKYRNDPVHYISFSIQSLWPVNKNITIDILVYEFLSNEYRRSFVEMHYEICSFLFTDQIFGFLFKRQLRVDKYPLPPAVYTFKDVALWNMPLLKTFPFQKGRVFLNFTRLGGETIIAVYYDAVIKARYI